MTHETTEVNWSSCRAKRFQAEDRGHGSCLCTRNSNNQQEEEQKKINNTLWWTNIAIENGHL